MMTPVFCQPDLDTMGHTKYENLRKGKVSDHLLYDGNDSTPFTGTATSRYKNGRIKFEGRYKNGVLDGKATWWHSDGKIEHEATYVNGRLEIFCTDSENKSRT